MVSNLEWATSKEQMEHVVGVLLINSGIDKMKPLIGKDKYGKVIYKFDSLTNCAKYFSSINNQSLKSNINSLWRVLTNRRKTFMKIYWEYL